MSPAVIENQINDKSPRQPIWEQALRFLLQSVELDIEPCNSGYIHLLCKDGPVKVHLSIEADDLISLLLDNAAEYFVGVEENGTTKLATVIRFKSGVFVNVHVPGSWEARVRDGAVLCRKELPTAA